MQEVQRYGNLTVLCPVNVDGRTRWLAVCDCGLMKSFLPSNVTSGRSTSCGHHGRANKRRRMGKPVGYMSAHSRIYRERGKAAEYPCVDGCGHQAEEWSYQGGCEGEYEGTDPKSTRASLILLKYCEHPRHYEPRCKPCHRRYDAQRENDANV